MDENRKKRTISYKFMQKRSRKHGINEGATPKQASIGQKSSLIGGKSSMLCNMRRIDITYIEFLDIFALGSLN
jgi:hypothetical protein